MALNTTKKAVVLLSGGLDSSTTLAVALKEGYECYALTINYQQRHHAEIEAAKRVASQLRVFDHKVIDLDLRAFGGSALTSEEAVPKNRSQASMACEIPVTYVPARNTVFLSIALAWAESLNAFDIFLGVNAVDYSGYPDCRPDFIRSFEILANLATKAGVEKTGKFKIHVPLIVLSKKEIIKLGHDLNLDFSLTHTCYDPKNNGKSCGLCDACILRLEGFKEAGLIDPISYDRVGL
jgi:7-cyano-7-deazaguanine synthase